MRTNKTQTQPMVDIRAYVCWGYQQITTKDEITKFSNASRRSNPAVNVEMEKST